MDISMERPSFNESADYILVWRIPQFGNVMKHVGHGCSSPTQIFCGGNWTITLARGDYTLGIHVNKKGRPESFNHENIVECKLILDYGEEEQIILEKEFVFHEEEHPSSKLFHFIQTEYITFPYSLIRPQYALKVKSRFKCSQCKLESTAGLLGVNGSVKLEQDLRSFKLNEQGYDITINVSGREFRAHRSILAAQSPVFSAMFSQNTLERQTGIVTVEDCDPDIFYLFLVYLYCGEVERLTFDKTFYLYALADKYDVQELKQKCINYMESFLSVDSFCDVIRLAYRYEYLQLIKVAIDFFLKNGKKIIRTVNWQCMLKEYPKICNELYIILLDHLSTE